LKLKPYLTRSCDWREKFTGRTSAVTSDPFSSRRNRSGNARKIAALPSGREEAELIDAVLVYSPVRLSRWQEFQSSGSAVGRGDYVKAGVAQHRLNPGDQDGVIVCD
jgi:hypothetical protein